jgi:hypothetical protein
MKNMNRKESKKIAVMAAIIMGLMMFAFMPLASAGVTSFTVTPSTGFAGAVDSYNALVTTTGVTTINITIPAGFIGVEPMSGGVEIARIDFWNSSTKAYYGYATFTANDTDPTTTQIDAYCELGGVTARTTQTVNYTPGATNTFVSHVGGNTSSVITKLPTETEEGSIKISINCTEFQLDDVMLAIKQFVRNPLDANTYEFIADEKSEWVSITAPSGRGIVFRNGVWFVDTNGNHIADVVFSYYGTTGGVPLVWGDNGVALFSNGRWLVDTTGDRVPDLLFYYGDPGDVPLVGDMNRDGIVDIAVFRKGMWYVNTSVDTITSNNPVGADLDFPYGLGEDVPLVGDMNRDGTSDIAVFRNGTWYIDTTGGSHEADKTLYYGDPGDVPLVGDFERDGTDDIAVFRNGMWYVDTTCIGILPPTLIYVYGIAGDIPLVGIIE